MDLFLHSEAFLDYSTISGMECVPLPPLERVFWCRKEFGQLINGLVTFVVDVGVHLFSVQVGQWIEPREVDPSS